MNANSADDRYLRLSEDIQQSLVGPMPADEFIDTFMLKPTELMPPTSNTFNAVPLKPVKENEMNLPIAEALNILCPTIMFADTDRVEKKWELKFGVGGYLSDNIQACTRPNGKIFAHFGFVQLWVGLKLQDFASDGSDHFCFEHIKDETDKNRAKLALGQMVAYAIESFSRQYRTHLFSVFMTNSIARLMRWDRSGLIITNAINYRTHPETLASFFWRFSQMSHDARGCDMTIKAACLEEEKLFASAINKHIRTQLGRAACDADIAIHYQAGQVVKVPVPSLSTAISSVDYLVSRPVVYPKTLASRATRGYWAVSLAGNVVFLKEAWRTATADMELEGAILTELRGKDPCVPTILEFGDVSPVHVTKTTLFSQESWNKGSRTQTIRCHYRQTVAEAGYIIETAAGAAEMFKGAFSAFDGIVAIFKQTSRLHRDVSTGNIVLYADNDNAYRQRRGLLIDWELSTVADERGSARDHKRTGTWSFASLRSIQASHKKEEYRHHISDDLESIIYVIFYCAISMLPWEYSKEMHSNLLVAFFGSRDGMGKAANMFTCDSFNSARFVEPGLNAWLRVAASAMRNCHGGHSESALTTDQMIAEFTAVKDARQVHLPAPKKDDRQEHPHPLPGPPARISWATTPTGTGSGFEMGVSTTASAGQPKDEDALLVKGKGKQVANAKTSTRTSAGQTNAIRNKRKRQEDEVQIAPSGIRRPARRAKTAAAERIKRQV